MEGIPSGVLSGGQYDKLMEKMNKSAGGIGFAVYLDQLERLNVQEKEFDVDVVLLYDQSTDISALTKAANDLSGNGDSVLLLKERPNTLRCKRLMCYRNGRLELLENNG